LTRIASTSVGVETQGQKMMRLLILAGSSLMLLVWPTGAGACECPPPAPACSAYPTVSAVFVATANVIPLAAHSQRTRLDVEEVLVGKVPEAVEVTSGGIGFSCDYDFKDRRRYLVYAVRAPDGQWKLPPCSATVPVERAATDLAFLRSLARGEIRNGRVSVGASIDERDSAGHPHRKGVLSGATLRLRSAEHVFAGETDLRGQYEFKEVPPGVYEITLRVSPRFDAPPPATIEVWPGGCASHWFAVMLKSPH
jgi:hypothetical protein